MFIDNEIQVVFLALPLSSITIKFHMLKTVDKVVS